MNTSDTTRTKEKSVKRRLKQGRDFHAWAWKGSTDSILHGFHYYAEPGIPDRRRHHNEHCEGEKGKWVRVKFVEVQS